MLNLPQYLFINGPTRSGKSTLATMLCKAHPEAWRESFAEPIREMIYAVFLPEQGMVNREIDLRDGDIKRMNLRSLAALDDETGLIVRKVMIDFSEAFMKPRFGKDIFGRLLWKRCEEQRPWYAHFIIDDSGFAPEAQYVISQIGAGNCVLLHLHRAGCDYSGDSRGYIDLHGVRTIDLHNDGAPEEMMTQLQLCLGNL